MEFSSGLKGRAQEIADLFTAVFAASEGAAEGALIGGLVRNLLGQTPVTDLHVFAAIENGSIIGAILFSRLSYDQDARSVFVLAPVAVATDRQGQRVGQRLIAHGLAALRDAGVDVAVTYGDPRFYTRLGFAPIAESFARAPYKLSQPEGWLGQSLTGTPLTPLKGPARCVAALDDPVFW